ncbi:hypothetical protein B0J15DRAFT_490969, partial [Fusarium solani]
MHASHLTVFFSFFTIIPSRLNLFFCVSVTRGSKRLVRFFDFLLIRKRRAASAVTTQRLESHQSHIIALYLFSFLSRQRGTDTRTRLVVRFFFRSVNQFVCESYYLATSANLQRGFCGGVPTFVVMKGTSLNPGTGM